MTKSVPTLPNAGGSFIRNTDGSLAPRHEDPETTPPEAEQAPEKTAVKATKQTDKEA